VATFLRGKAKGGTVGAQAIDAQEVRRSLSLLLDPSACVEFRALYQGPAGKRGARSLVRRGDRPDDWVEAVEALNPSAEGVYYTLNPTTMLEGFDRGAHDDDVSRRRWVLVDVDPAKPEGKSASATDAEKEAARRVASSVFDWLASISWPEPLWIDSGNGWHLLYRVDEPADDDTRAVVKSLLAGLAARFNVSDGGSIDRSVHNASRIAKLPGTWARKGPDTPERPHRMARLYRVPPVQGTVSRSQLVEAVAALGVIPGRTPAVAPAPPSVRKSGHPWKGKATAADDGRHAYALAALAAEEAACAAAKRGQLNPQLFASGAALGNFVGAGLLSESEVYSRLIAAIRSAGANSPAKDDDTLRRAIAKGMAQPRDVPSREPLNGDGKPQSGLAAEGATEKPRIIRMADLLAIDLPEPRWAIPGILSEGLSILAGKPKLGKSWLALNFALTIAAGGKALGSVQVMPGDVLYLSLEDRFRRVQDRTRKVLKGLPVEANRRLHVAVEWPRMGAGGLDALGEWVQSVEAPRLIVIDVWAKFRPLATGIKSQSAYDVDYEHGTAIKAFADRCGCSILILHHTKKAQEQDAVDEVSGTLGLAGSADGIVVLNRQREKKEAKLFLTGRDVEETTLALEVDQTTWVWTSHGTEEGRVRSKIGQAILEFFRANGGASFYPSEVATAMGDDYKANTIQQQLLRMVTSGHLRKIGSKYAWPGPGASSPLGDDDEIPL